MKKAKYADYRITRNAEDTDLKDDDFAFVFNADGVIRAVQINGHLEDDDELPHDVNKMIEYVAELKLLSKVGRTYH